jgi:hypothetical protein
LCCAALGARADDAPQAAQPAEAPPNQIGRSIFVVNDVDGKSGDAPAHRIAVNDDILFEEDITTGDDAKAVLEFRDGSTFEIGPDAAVRIDSFVFNPAESTSHKALSVTRGVFRYVSGYVATDQDTRIATPQGQLGIRGSVAAGIVDPGVPDFVYLGEGSATFTNAAGSSALQPGNAIAVPSAGAPPMAPAAMPAPVAAQALQVIERRLPPRTALANRPAASEAWLKSAGVADLVPVAQQQQAGGPARSPLAVGGPAPGLAGELGLLVEGNRLELFNGRSGARTPEQTAFLARAERENPNAPAAMRRFTSEAHAMHSASMTAGTAFVIRGVGHAAPSAEVMRRVVAASVRANPGAAAAINRHAGESYRGPDRANFTRERPEAHPTERRAPPENPRASQARPQRPPPNMPPKGPPPKKEPPRKRGQDQNQNQR